MRRGNLPDGRHDKVIWKRSRDGSNSETWWRRTTATLLGVSFGSYRRCCRDVLKGCSGYLPLRHLGDVPLRFRWVLHLKLVWYVVETNWWEVVITSHETSSRHTNKSLWRLPLWRIGDDPLRRCWVFHLGHTCNVAGTYRETLLRLRHNVLLPVG